MMEIEDAQIIGENQLGAPSGSGTSQKGKLPNWIVTLANLVTYNDKGKLATQALSAYNVVKNKPQFEAYFQQHKDVINGYFNQIDLQKVNQQFGSQAKPVLTGAIKGVAANNLPGLLFGLAGGLLVGGLFLRLNPASIDFTREDEDD
ncbi:MAG TPA: hypothetical protein VKA34_19320 [Balneolales bacterium]|nr:hypothetical protein [Balneolales bacterium]